MFIPYAGSKGKLAKTIIKRPPEDNLYVEVFTGRQGRIRQAAAKPV